MNVSNSLKHKGFTLIELLVVIGIIMTVVGVSAPIILRQIEKGLEAKAMSTMKDLNAAIFDYSADNHGFLPTDGAADADADVLIDTKDEKYFLRTLRGESDALNNFSGKTYFHTKPALEDNTYGMVGTGNDAWLADPWGRAYLIYCDYSGDGSLDTSDLAADLLVDGIIKLETSEADKTLRQVAAPICRGGTQEEDESDGSISYTDYLITW